MYEVFKSLYGEKAILWYDKTIKKCIVNYEDYFDNCYGEPVIFYGHDTLSVEMLKHSYLYK